MALKAHPGTHYEGDTTADYVEVALIKSGAGAVFLIRNTHATATLKFKATIKVNSHADTQEYEIIEETILSPSETPTLVTGIDSRFYTASIYVKNGDGASSYEIDTGRY